MTTDPPGPPAVHAVPATPPFRILVVDDNRDAADTTALLLGVAGFETRTCYDGHAALQEAARFLPGVCLIDLNMPGMDGDELAIRLRPVLACRRVLLVAVTAMSGEQYGARIAAAGFHLHLVKPVNPRQLVAVVNAQWQLWASGRVDTPAVVDAG